MRIFKTVLREIPENLASVLFVNSLSAVAATSIVALVSAATKEAASGRISARLLLMFAISSLLFHVTQIHTLVTSSIDSERLIHKLRVRLFNLVRKTDLVTIDRIGRANLQGVLTQDTQILAEVLPMLVIGFQHAIILVFLAIYLTWLSPFACILAFGLAGLTVAVRFKRVHSLRTLMQSAASAEGGVFDGLTELLNGFKEVRMNGPRADGVINTLREASHTSRTTNSQLKAQWGRNYAIIEAMLYSLAGLIVFVVPLFVPGFYEVALPATIAVLFIAGPVSTVSFVTPMLTQAELALENIETMENNLSAAAEAASCEEIGQLDQDPLSIALHDATLSYRDTSGSPLFSVGPLNAEFNAGQITFITGGNGSGKSTLLRLLTGLIPLDNGSIVANGTPVTTEQMQDYRNRISAIFSDFHLSRRLYSVKDPDRKTISTLLERLEMHDKVSVRDGSFSTIDLSTGQRKRLALIVAELEDKQVLVLDEWAADQDPHFRRIFYEELLPDLKARGKIVICVTHDERWFHIADRIYKMNEGRIEEQQKGSS